MLLLLLLATAGGSACVGTIGSDSTEGSGAGSSGGEVPGAANADVVGFSGLRRLTIDEYDNTLSDLLLDESRSSDLLLPKDARNPFDNDYSEQLASQALIEGAYLLAADAAGRLMADPQKRDKVIGCVPSEPADAACFGTFIETFGRRALRRPLTADEKQDYQEQLEYATETSDFYVAADTAIRAFLQDPEFLYRVEIGAPAAGQPGVFALDDHEVGTRLAYFLLGTTPPDTLLDRADEGGLSDEAGIRAAAEELLTDERAQARIARFHALWLGYENLPHAADLSAAMHTETDKLIEKVVFGEGVPYAQLFTSSETWIDDQLAEQYGLPLPGEAKWVDYGDSGRGGILSHGSFLSVAGKFNDTSPTQRGILIRTRLFCQVIPPPPPDVNTDDAIPTTDEAFCKIDRLAAHRQGGCAGCHDQMDPIGLGLENFDQQGRFRTHESDNPETTPDESTCEIAGDGEITDVGTFNGPAELGELMVGSGLVEQCVTTQLYRFAMGRYALDEFDREFVSLLVEKAAQPGFNFSDLMVAFVTNDAFRFRREEE